MNWRDKLARPTDEQVILIHGLGRSRQAMWRLARYCQRAGFVTHSLSYPTLFRELSNCQDKLFSQLQRVTAAPQLAKTHFICHSMGGLMLRSYLETEPGRALLPKLGQVVMLGTPNQGTQIVDCLSRYPWFAKLGEATRYLGTGVTAEHVWRTTLPEPPFRAGIIAGSKGLNITDQFFGEANDGLVPVSSTKLSNMADFITVPCSHGLLRYHSQVCRQSVHFIRHGRFASA